MLVVDVLRRPVDVRRDGHPRVSARNSATLRDLRIFVDHSAEPVTPSDLGLGYVGLGECS